MKNFLFTSCLIVSLCSTASIHSYADTEYLDARNSLFNHSNAQLKSPVTVDLQSKQLTVPKGVKVVNIDSQPFTYNSDNNKIDKILSQNSHADILALGGIHSHQQNSHNVPLNNISPETLKTFVKVINLVRREYVNPVSDEQLFINAMQGMLKNLDNNAELLDAQSYSNAQAFAQGELAEIGLQTHFNKSQNNWVVLDVSPQSPASLAGIKAGYYLHEIDDVKLNKYTNEHDIKQILNGLAGSMVDVVFSNEGRRLTKATLQRTLPKRSSVKINLHKNIAIISIPSFQDNTKKQILDALVKLNKPVYGVVLDLRDNPGGMLTSAIEVAGLFLNNKNVVQIENKKRNIHILKTKKGAYLGDLPVVVLQNRYSASAAEVLAGSLKHHQKAKVVGETSYGKGTIQSVVPINDNQAVKLTVANYLTPSGQRIEGQGLKADIDFNKNDQSKYFANSINQKTINTHSQSFNPIIDYYDDNVNKTKELQWQKRAVDILLQQISLKNNMRNKKKSSIFSRFRKTSSKKSSNTDDIGMLFVYPSFR